jgi:hypothetical protein
METKKTNPKALNLSVLEETKHKVTLGFTCPPIVKLELAQEAKKLDITLSEYVEHLVMNRTNLKPGSQEEIEKLNTILSEHKNRIEFYENSFLKALFLKYKGQSHEYTDASGKKNKLEIKSVQDIYTIVINSFKFKP